MSDNPSDAPAVAVILVNWNGWRDTIECLDALLAQRHRNFHVFVVDNDSRDGSVEQLLQWCRAPRAEPDWRTHPGVERHTAGAAPALPCRLVDQPRQPLPPADAGCRISLIRSGGNLGFAGGCNVGIRAASPAAFDFFWFLNTDTVVHQDALSALLRRAGRDPDLGMVGSTVRYYDAPDTVQALGGARLDQARGLSRHIGEGLPAERIPADPAAVERELSYIFGASMLVSARYVREVGLMQEDYFLYFEEIDWALRGADRFRLGYAADSQVFHKSGASSSKTVPRVTIRYFYRNRIRFVSRYFPRALAATRRRVAFDVFYYLAKRRWAEAWIVAGVWWNARRIAAQARLQA
jgi:GT2 family glycosyltransferase